MEEQQRRRNRMVEYKWVLIKLHKEDYDDYKSKKGTTTWKKIIEKGLE
jgi:hypothetical protein